MILLAEKEFFTLSGVLNYIHHKFDSFKLNDFILNCEFKYNVLVNNSVVFVFVFSSKRRHDENLTITTQIIFSSMMNWRQLQQHRQLQPYSKMDQNGDFVFYSSFSNFFVITDTKINWQQEGF